MISALKTPIELSESLCLSQGGAIPIRQFHEFDTECISTGDPGDSPVDGNNLGILALEITQKLFPRLTRKLLLTSPITNHPPVAYQRPLFFIDSS